MKLSGIAADLSIEAAPARDSLPFADPTSFDALLEVTAQDRSDVEAAIEAILAIFAQPVFLPVERRFSAAPAPRLEVEAIDLGAEPVMEGDIVEERPLAREPALRFDEPITYAPQTQQHKDEAFDLPEAHSGDLIEMPAPEYRGEDIAALMARAPKQIEEAQEKPEILGRIELDYDAPLDASGRISARKAEVVVGEGEDRLVLHIQTDGTRISIEAITATRARAALLRTHEQAIGEALFSKGLKLSVLDARSEDEEEAHARRHQRVQRLIA